jgi:uncharacterized protein YukE
MQSNGLNVDPERLREFAGKLLTYADKVSEYERSLTSGLARLGETFRDQGFQQFREQFLSSKEDLSKFVEEIRKVVPQLKEDADIIDSYHRIKSR